MIISRYYTVRILCHRHHYRHHNTCTLLLFRVAPHMHETKKKLAISNYRTHDLPHSTQSHPSSAVHHASLWLLLRYNSHLLFPPLTPFHTFGFHFVLGLRFTSCVMTALFSVFFFVLAPHLPTVRPSGPPFPGILRPYCTKDVLICFASQCLLPFVHISLDIFCLLHHQHRTFLSCICSFCPIAPLFAQLIVCYA